MDTEVDGSLQAQSSVRPIRVAYLIERGKHEHLVLDAVFADAYSRWGGRFSLLVPCAEGRIDPRFWPWLEAFDPDIIYSYSNLEEAEVLKLHERIYPADYLMHKARAQGESARLDVAVFRPHFNIALLSSLSTIFRLARHLPRTEGSAKLKILNSWWTENVSSFLLDNFGVYSRSAAAGIFPADAASDAGLLTIVSDSNFSERKFAIPRDLDKIENEHAALREFAARRVTSMATLSSLFARRLSIEDWRWSGDFNIVVGDSFEDRLLFWNTRLLIPSWLDGELCSFRVTFEQLRDAEFRSVLTQIVNTRNHVSRGGSNSPEVRIRSASHSDIELRDAVALLQSSKLWGLSAQPEVVLGSDVIPAEQALRDAREKDGAAASLLSTADNGFSWKPPTARIPLVQPDHLLDAPHRQAFLQGQWATDLVFHGVGRDATRFGINRLWLPRWWRLDRQFKLGFASRGFGADVTHTRCERKGALTVFAGIDRVLESVTVPEIDGALTSSLCRDSNRLREYPGDPKWPKAKATWARRSNEAPHLEGVLGMTGGLDSARGMLLHPFLQRILGKLGGSPNLSDSDMNLAMNSLRKRVRQGHPTIDLTQSNDMTYLAALLAKVGKTVSVPRVFIPLVEIQKDWALHREEYWKLRPSDETDRSPEELDQRRIDETQSLDDCLAQMRSRRMIFQGHAWTCHACLHRNWAPFDRLALQISCDVCHAESDLPVEILWKFRANDFLIESLRSHSVLSLIWLLSALQNRARTSFFYAGPTAVGFEESENISAEIDLLAVVDGECILCEVKASWKTLRTSDIDKLIACSRRFRPNRAILAVMEDGSALTDKITEAKSAIESEGIAFEILTPSSYRVDDSPYVPAY